MPIFRSCEVENVFAAGARMEPVTQLNDEQWTLIKDCFPNTKLSPQGGRPKAVTKACFEGILWILRSGARGKDLPKCFPSLTTCWRRHSDWSASGVWKKAWGRLLQILDPQGEIDRQASMADGTLASAKKG